MSSLDSARKILEYGQRVFDIVSIAGFLGALAVAIRFLTSPAFIAFDTNGSLWIQNVPFSWIMSSLVVASFGSFMRGVRAILGTPKSG